MTAYMIVLVSIKDEKQLAKYRQAVMPLIKAFGGKHVRGGAAELLEGRQNGRRIALFEFQSMEAIHAFWHSPEYVPVKELRRDAAEMEIWAVPGPSSGPSSGQHDV